MMIVPVLVLTRMEKSAHILAGRQQSTLHCGNMSFQTASRLGYSLIGLFLAGILFFVTARPLQVLPRIGLAPGYSLVDQDGQTLTSEDLRGRITLYNFTYGNCQAPCVDTTPQMQTVVDRLNDLDEVGVPVRLVTISVDPNEDTPARLRTMGEQYGADFTQWRFATGDAQRLKYVVGGGFGVYYADRPGGGITLDPAFFLVDGAGLLRAEYRTATPDVAVILRDIKLIAQEALNSTGATRLAYEAAHLFVCYPR
jgi:protein SCO1